MGFSPPRRRRRREAPRILCVCNFPESSQGSFGVGPAKKKEEEGGNLHGKTVAEMLVALRREKGRVEKKRGPEFNF